MRTLTTHLRERQHGSAVNFKIEEKTPSLPHGLTCLWSGTKIIHLDIPMVFTVATSTFPEGFIVEFVVRLDAERQERGIIKENLRNPLGYRLLVLNPVMDGTQTYPLKAIPILGALGGASGMSLLSCMFVLQHIQQTNMFILFIEFFDDTTTLDADPAMRRLVGRDPP